MELKDSQIKFDWLSSVLRQKMLWDLWIFKSRDRYSRNIERLLLAQLEREESAVSSACLEVLSLHCSRDRVNCVGNKWFSPNLLDSGCSCLVALCHWTHLTTLVQVGRKIQSLTELCIQPNYSFWFESSFLIDDCIHLYHEKKLKLVWGLSHAHAQERFTQIKVRKMKVT
jgi:hypothetical protein